MSVSSESRGHSANSTRSKPDKETEAVDESKIKCDYKFCAPAFCQRLRNRKLLLFWLCWCAFAQGMLVNGLINSVITTLERRYRLTSTESGAIASLYDVGVVLVLIPLSYYGGKWRRMRVLSWGMLLMGLGSFLFALPQATSGVYSYQTPIEPLCYRNTNVSYDVLCTDDKKHLNNYKFLFWISHLLIGIGASPLYTLGVSYLDDNLSSVSAPVYFGIFYTMSLIGPGGGYLSASQFLSIYVDIGREHPGLDSNNAEIWVGAWWLGFLITGCMAIIAFIPTFGFPREFPGTAEIRANKKSEAFGNSESTAQDYKLSIKDSLKNLSVLLCNPTFMLISCSGFLESMMLSGMSTFGPKYLESTFFLNAGTATLLFGAILIPAGGTGMLFGGLFIRCFKFGMKGILRLQFVLDILVLPFMGVFFLTCGIGKTAGISVPYSGSGPLLTMNLSSSCNSDCNCRSDSALFLTSCGINQMTYYSPCYAGCETKTATGFGNCSCIPSNKTLGNDELTAGSCSVSCISMPIFLAFFAVVVCILFTITTPSLTSTLRSVPEKQKTFALGIQWLIVRILGTIPGPIIFGASIDSTCSQWNVRCSTRGSCAFYDRVKLRDIILIIGFVLKSLSALCLLGAWLLYKQPPEEKTNEAETPTETQPAPDKNQDNGDALSGGAPHEGYDNPSYVSTVL